MKKSKKNKKNIKNTINKKNLIIAAAVLVGIFVVFIGISAAILPSRAVGAWQWGGKEPIYSWEYGCSITREILLEEGGAYAEVILNAETEEVLSLKTGTWKTGFLTVTLQEEGSESSVTYSLNIFSGQLSHEGITFIKD